jgi:hypothetical protein
MNEMIPPYGFLNDVLPGDPWQPEPAARYNAVNELLKKEYFPEQGKGFFFRQGSSGFLTVKNTSAQEIVIGSAVKIDTDHAVTGFSRISFSDPFVCGQPMTDGKGFWGLAAEKIAPGHAGVVQVSGVAVIRNLKGAYNFPDRPVDTTWKRNEYVFTGKDGSFHLGSHGRGRVLFYDKDSSCAVVLLGECPHAYDGMFAVSDNGNNTLTVKGGITDLDKFYSSDSAFEEKTLAVVTASSEWHYVCLIATWSNYRWKLSVDIHRYPDNYFYIPGEKIFVPLARYMGTKDDGYVRDLVQLHQGGIVNFRERYYIEE